jgi:hypothetical protein
MLVKIPLEPFSRAGKTGRNPVHCSSLLWALNVPVVSLVMHPSFKSRLMLTNSLFSRVAYDFGRCRSISDADHRSVRALASNGFYAEVHLPVSHVKYSQYLSCDTHFQATTSTSLLPRSLSSQHVRKLRIDLCTGITIYLFLRSLLSPQKYLWKLRTLEVTRPAR